MNKKAITLGLILFGFSFTQAQNKISDASFFVNRLDTETFGSFFDAKIQDAQFILLGEQHGIAEVGKITNALYEQSRPLGFNTLCVETSPFAASILQLQFTSADNPKEGLQKLYETYPFSIPFYNNANDIVLFENLTKHRGKLWGIDQVFMAEFRLVFDYLVNLSDDRPLKSAVVPLLEQAILDFEKAIENKDFTAPFIFNYTDSLHNKLIDVATGEAEKNMLESLKLTKEIYTYNFNGQFYENNHERAKLMKRNFLSHYNEAASDGSSPRILMKLGANHVAKGLTKTNVLDIGNLAAEIAFTNNLKSLHIYAVGVNGAQYLGNPFAPVPVVPFDNSQTLPEEVQRLLNEGEEKYLIIDSEGVRPIANTLSNAMKQLVLQYDVLIFIRDCEPLESLNPAQVSPAKK